MEPANFNRMEGEFPVQPEPVLPTTAMDMDIVVRFGRRYINFDDVIDSDQAQQPLDVQWGANRSFLYTLMLIDNDMPYPNSNEDSPFLLTLIVNIPGNDYQNGQVVMPYQMPTLYANSDIHRLNLLIYQQTRAINQQLFSGNYQTRANFDVDSYQQQNGLISDYNFVFYVTPMVTNTDNIEIEPLQLPAAAQPTNVFAQRYNYVIPAASSSCGCRGKAKDKGGERERSVQNYANQRSTYSTTSPPTGVTVQPRYQNPRIRPDSQLTEQEQKYCSCVVQVEAKEGDRYNPYAVCHSSVGGAGRPDCGDNYDWPKLTDAELIGYARGKHGQIVIPNPYDREQMLNNIKQWKHRLGKSVNF